MIFYHPDFDLRFSEYGIEIPIVDDRALKVFNALKEKDQELSYTDLKILPELSREDLYAVHHKDYIDRLFGTEEELTNEVLSCYELIDKDGRYLRYNPTKAARHFSHALTTILNQSAMTYLSSKNALTTGFSYYLGGGMHHAMSFGGRGFCLLNDIVITLKKLQREKYIEHAWVIDVDAHKGDGTAELTKTDSSIATMSIHMQDGWPLNGGESTDPWFIPSSIDVGIKEGEEKAYLERLKDALDEMEKKYPRPNLVIVVNGADPFEFDELQSSEKLKLTKEQMLKRDKLVYQFFLDRKIPQSYVMAGGYGARSWEIYAQFLQFVRENSSERSKISSR